MSPRDKPLVWLRGAVKSPPFGPDARLETGYLLRRLQRGELLSLPHSRPMTAVGPSCHELRIIDGVANWRLMYHIDPDAIVILDVFAKKTTATPRGVLDDCRKRLAEFQRVMKRPKGAGHARR